jgi:predicted nucleic-acid-binding protein
MVLLDANTILRYILCDHQEQYEKAVAMISENTVVTRYEVVAEVIYVLHGFYKKERAAIADKLSVFFRTDNVQVPYPAVMATALQLYAEKNLDFVDCILVAFNNVSGYGVFTFDKKMAALLR